MVLFGLLAVPTKGLPGNSSNLFLMLPYVLTMFLLIFFSRKNHPPKAAGEDWDKGKR